MQVSFVSVEDGIVVRPSEKAPSGKKSKLICVGIGITDQLECTDPAHSDFR